MSCRLACNCSQSARQMRYHSHAQGLKQRKKKAVKVLPLDHEAIMEEASKCDWLEYNNNDNDNDESKEESDEGSKENKSKSKSK